MMPGHFQLLPEVADSIYREYCEWIRAVHTLSPKALARKYGVSETTIHAYGQRRLKTLKRRAA